MKTSMPDIFEIARKNGIQIIELLACPKNQEDNICFRHKTETLTLSFEDFINYCKEITDGNC